MNGRTPVLVAGARTPIGRLGGMLSGHTAVELGSAAIRAVLARGADIAPEYVVMGNVVQAGNGQNPARIAAVGGGAGRQLPGITLNDVCLASMSAVSLVSRMILAGEISAGLVGGFESMSRAPWAVQRARGKAAAARGRPAAAPGGGPNCAAVAPDVAGEPVDLLVRDGLWCALDGVGMGPLSDAENTRLGIGREEQDEFAAESHRRAAGAAASGRLAVEIAVGDLDCASDDEGIRPDSSAAALSMLKPAFTDAGTITAGNASQLSDAAAAGLVTSFDRADQAGLEPLAAIEGWASVAGPDSSLHLMPALASTVLLGRHGLAAGQVGLWEINEAFSGVVIASARELCIELDRVNVNGGAVALGHPLGASGFRLVHTLALEMRRRDVEFGVATICGGGGQGAAMLLRSL